MARTKKTPAAEARLIEWWRVETSEGVQHIPAMAFDGRPTEEAIRDDLTTPFANGTVTACSDDVVVLPGWRKVKGWSAYYEAADPPIFGPFPTAQAAAEALKETYGVVVEPDDGKTPRGPSRKKT